MDDPELAAVESIYDAIDQGDPETALRLARAALAESSGDDPVLRFLCGVALLDLDAAESAVLELRRAVELDADDGEFRANLALALFRCCRFDEAAAAVEDALRRDDVPPDLLVVQAVLLERRGALEQADRLFAQASELDAERYPAPVRLSREEFDRQLTLASGQLPDEIRRHLDEVVLIVEDVPSEDVLRSEDPVLDPFELLGLFVGLVRADRGPASAGGELPSAIYLFQRNLERVALERDTLLEEITITLRHELGHYLGLDEEDLEALGYD